MLFKLIRAMIGGTWLKIKTCDKTREYWCRPTNPESMEQLAQVNLVKKERYNWCLINTQYA